MENLSVGSSRPTVLGCSCANKSPPSFVPTRPSALSGPCQTSFHWAPAAMTPGISETVTRFSGLGCGKAPPVLCCATAVPLRTRADPRKQHAIVPIDFRFISSPISLARRPATKDRPVERSRFQPQQLRRIGLGHLHNVRLGDAMCHQTFVERQQPISMERIVGLTQVG